MVHRSIPKSSVEKRSSCSSRETGPEPRSPSRFGIADGSLAAWVKEHQKRSAPGALSEDERAELKRLRRENAELKQDREILKKAAQHFAREATR